MHTDWYEKLNKKMLETYWPRSAGKTSAMKTIFGMDIGLNDSLSVNQMVMMDGDGKIRAIIGEQDMCTEGAAPKSYREERLEQQVRSYEQNHLGAETERFIAMARELGQNDHLRQLVEVQREQIDNARYEAKRAVEQAAYSDNETDKANKRARNWETNYYTVERRYEAYKKKNAPKKKAVAKKK